MRVKIVAVAAIAASIFALPVPASQMLAGTATEAGPAARIVAGNANFGLLIEDPFLIDRMSLVHPMSHTELDAALRAGF